MFRDVFSGTAAAAWISVLLIGMSWADESPNRDGSPKKKESTEEIKSAKTVLDNASYGIGLNIGQSIKADGLELNLDELVEGMLDALQSKEPKLPAKQLQSALESFQRDTAIKQEKRIKRLSEKNKKEGKLFLETNRIKKGVVTLPSGLQYSVIKQGAGPSPKLTDRVKIHYQGTRIDGSVFHSSLNGEPAEMSVSEPIRGWIEALQKMKVGDKWKLVIPTELAYGADVFPPEIGPNAVLIFEIELLEILK